MSLKEYQRKRKFQKTPEPRGAQKSGNKGNLSFVVQKHAATRMHYDFRLELNGVLKSWAVPKGPSLTSQDPRLAVQVEDHPLEYGSFEGVIPRGNYGAGTVMVWDSGTFVERTSENRQQSEKALRKGLDKGHITFLLEGKKLRGEFALVRLKKKNAPDKGWLLIKKHDAEATRSDVLLQDHSVLTGRSMNEIAQQAEKKGEIWLPKKGRAPMATAKPVVKKPALTPAKKKVTMPHRVRVMEPVSSAESPKSGHWIYENSGTGYRAIAEIEGKRVKFYSRAFLPFEKKYPNIISALKKLDITAVLDGEIVEQNYVVNDVLYLNNEDLRSEPLKKRKRVLESLPLNKPLQIAETSKRPGGVQGICIVKNLEAPYVAGTSRDWLKIKVVGPKSAKKEISEGPPLTNLDKVFWPKEKITKGDLIHYYEKIADTILPHLKDRPESLHRQPDGVRNEGFFHKDMVGYLPRRMQTTRVFSGSAKKTVNYVLCQDRWSLLYLINLGCIELNPWISKYQNLDNPEMVIIDLDPDENDFNEVVKVALETHQLLKKIGITSFCKTSGATGLHICIPTLGKYDFDFGREFAEKICNLIHRKLPKITSVERNPAKRRRLIYLDFLQNRRGQTLAAPYCVRPRPKATVSIPLKWSEVKRGLSPESFTIETAPRRIERLGDLWEPMLTTSNDLETAMTKLAKLL